MSDVGLQIKPAAALAVVDYMEGPLCTRARRYGTTSEVGSGVSLRN